MIMEKTKSNRHVSSLISLVAILSVIVIFFLVCFLIMVLLYNLGVYKLPESFLNNNAETNESREAVQNVGDSSVTFASYGYSNELYSKILKSIPIQNNFYIQADVTTYDESSTEITYHYEIWRYGERYRIAILDYATYQPVKLIICDGERIKILFVETNQTEYHDVKEGYSFLEQTPIIDFSFLDEGEEYGYIESANMNGKEIEYVIQYTLIDEVINISVNTEEYVPSSYTIIRRGKTLREYKLISYENVDYFTPSQFIFD